MRIFCKANQTIVYSLLFTCILLALPVQTCAKSAESKTYKNLETFANVLSTLEKNYVDGIDSEEVIQGAIRGMLSSLDPHSSYMNKESFKDLQIETQGSFTGIGIEITIKDRVLVVVSPIEGTPAYKEGLKAGDKIIKIGKDSTKDMGLMDAVKLLRGKKGSKVTISIHRKGWTDLKEITITRAEIPLHSVKSELLAPSYGYIRITSFQTKTTRDTRQALKRLSKKTKLKGLVLDLRNNPGGLLDQAVKISDLFLDKGMIVYTKGRLENQNIEYKAHTGGPEYTFPVVVLVNGGSASASEIVAGALQDRKRALILGIQTFGKGSVQTVFPMNNGAGLRLTTARYYTPNGRSIQAKGITPDIIVAAHQASWPDEKESEHKVLREKDLKHHLENGSELAKKKPTKIDNDTVEGDKNTDSDEKDKIKELLKSDNQLQSAFSLLKGINIFEQFSSR